MTIQSVQGEGASSPALILESTQTATTYSFRAVADAFGWASCTINDATGELLITSDWGNWSHRWDPRPSCLGAPNLTTFIGTRSDIDYLARKLQHGSGQQWSARVTATNLRRQLCRRRLEDGRAQHRRQLEPGEWDGDCGLYNAEGLPLLSDRYVEAPTWNNPRRKERLPYLTCDTARMLWNEIGRLADEYCYSNGDLFYVHVQQLDGFGDYVTEESWNFGGTEQTPGDKALRALVLPALISALRERTQ